MKDDYETATRGDLKDAAKVLDGTLSDISGRLDSLESNITANAAYSVEIFKLVRRGVWFLVFVQITLFFLS